MLKTDIPWNLKMAIVYRAERKKIIRNQLLLINKVLTDLEAIIRTIGDVGKEIQPE